MLTEGDIVQISELSSFHAKSWVFKLTKDEELSTHLGKVIHNDIIGHEYGDVFSLTKGQVMISYPTPRDFIRHYKLRTQILYEDDCIIACSLAGVGSGMKVGEAGSGSGALTSFLAYYVQPNGKVFSFDINPDHLDNARKNLESAKLSKNVDFILHDIRTPIRLKDLDAFFLDFSTPFEAIDNLVPVIKGGGHLVCFVPNWGQVEKTIHTINTNPNFTLLNVFEITRRNFVVKPEKHIMRPVFRDLVYSGILIHSIKINPVKE